MFDMNYIHNSEGFRCRRIDWPAGSPAAHDCFAAMPEHFSALLEDSGGGGRQYLCSRSGFRLHLPPEGASPDAAEDFFSSWQRHLADGVQHESPGIRCLIYASYEAGRLLEVLPRPKSTPPVALLWLLFPDWSICFDTDTESVYLCSNGKNEGLDELEAMLRSSVSRSRKVPGVVIGEIHQGDPAAYMQAVERTKAYIAAGDIFQANIARFWQAALPDEQGAALYGRLRTVNPAPFSAFLRVETEAESMQLISASPERLFRLHPDGWADTRPIAGTRRRASGEKDGALGDELLLSEKERAEHIMLLDLERNDLGRVCRPGSVEVNECMVIERYSTVQHIVSNVRGELAEGRDAVDLFQAMFPGGTITGCPKVRCMEVIHEMGDRARGPYTGGIGYIGWDGSADMNILIRTFWLYRNRLHWAAGAGIVADSSPVFELEEAGYKAEGLLRAIR